MHDSESNVWVLVIVESSKRRCKCNICNGQNNLKRIKSQNPELKKEMNSCEKLNFSRQITWGQNNFFVIFLVKLLEFNFNWLLTIWREKYYSILTSSDLTRKKSKQKFKLTSINLTKEKVKIKGTKIPRNIL